MYYSIVALVNANVGIDTSLAEQTVGLKSMDLISCTTLLAVMKRYKDLEYNLTLKRYKNAILCFCCRESNAT